MSVAVAQRPFAYAVGQRVLWRWGDGQSMARIARRLVDREGQHLYWVRRSFRPDPVLVREPELCAVGAYVVEEEAPMPWTLFEKPRHALGGPRVAVVPTVNIVPSGNLSLNALAVEALGSPAFVELMYDHELRLIGLRASDAATWHARKLSRYKGGKSLSAVVGAKAFFEHFGIAYAERSRHPATLVGDVLIVDLGKAA